VKGKMMPLRARRKHDDSVEIVTQTGHKPSRDWLNFAATSRARNKIKHLIHSEEKTRSVELGRKLFEKERGAAAIERGEEVGAPGGTLRCLPPTRIRQIGQAAGAAPAVDGRPAVGIPGDRVQAKLTADVHGVTALLVGMIGYHYLEGMAWIDAYANAAMILSGMGPLDPPKTASGKLFAGTYALYSGLAVILAAGILFTPVVHRMLHKFHLEDDTAVDDRKESGKGG